MDQALLKNANFATSLNRYFNGQKRLVFYIERHQTLSPGVMYLKGNTEEISKIFDQNYGLTTFKKCKFCDFFKSVF